MISLMVMQQNCTLGSNGNSLRLTPIDARRGTSISRSPGTRSHASLGLIPLPTQYINPLKQRYANTITTTLLFRLRRAEILGIVRLQEWIPVLRILPAAVSQTPARRVHPQIFHWAMI